MSMYIGKFLKFFLLLLCGWCMGGQGYAQQECTVEVITRDVKDGTVFYLQDAEGSIVYDSAVAKGNRFSLRAILAKDVTQALVYEKKYDAYIFVWLTAGRLKIEQTGKTLRTALVTGNELQAHARELSDLEAPIEKKMEALEATIEKSKSESKRKALIAEYEALNTQQEQLVRNYVRKYPERLYSAYVMDVYKTTWGSDSVGALFQLMPASLQQSSYGQHISRFLALVAPSQPGNMAANVKQPDTIGNIIELQSFKGKWVLLEFWASWCGPCRAENPQLVETYNQFKDKNFEILAVSLDKGRDEWIKAIEKDGLPWKHISELNGSENTAALTYSVNGIPDNVVIDPSGKIVARGLRGQSLKQFLSEHL